MKGMLKRLSAFLMCMALAVSSPALSLASGAVPEPGVEGSAEAQYNEDKNASEAQTEVDILVYSGVVITDQSENTVIRKGDDLTIGISVEGIGPFTFQWEVSFDEGQTWQIIEGADGITYDIEDAQYLPGDNEYDTPYHYRATVTDGYGHTATTDPENIEVLVSPDMDEYVYRRIEDEETDIAATALMHTSTILDVTVIPEDDSVYQLLSEELIPGHAPLITADVELYSPKDGVDPDYIGSVEVEFPVGEEFNGETIRIFQLVDGEVVIHTVVVEDGVATVVVDEPSQFMVESPVKEACVITVTTSEGGTTNPSGEISVAGGEDKTIVILPDAGYQIGEVLVDGEPVEITGNTYVFEDVEEDHTFDVTFEKIESTGETHTVTVKYEWGGIATPSGTFEVEDGEAFTVSVATYSGYAVEKVLVNGVEYDLVGGYLTLPSITEDTVIDVRFKKDPDAPYNPVMPNYTITSTAGEGGTISPLGANTVTHGGDMHFYIIPDEGYVIDTVKVDGKVVDMTDNSYHFINVLGDHTIEATFRKDDGTGGIEAGEMVKVDAWAGEHGSISPSGTQYVAKGCSQTFFFIPDKGYIVRRVFVNGEIVAITRKSHTLYNITEDMTIYVEFEWVGGGYSTGEDIRQENFTWCWILLGAAGGVALLMIILIILRRKKDEEDEVPDDNARQSIDRLDE